MAPARRPHVDWLRGIAVLSMIEWHVLDAWTSIAARQGAAWPSIKVIGGFAAPLFLFLAGVAVPFAIRSQIAKGAEPRVAAWRVQRRGWQVFLIAHLFRLQSFLLNPHGKWAGILKPDILNILGLGLAGTAWLAGRGSAPGRRVWWLLVPAIAILALTPMAPYWWWPTLLAEIHPRFEAYIRPVNGLGVFALFPWVAFVPVGAFVGALMTDARDVASEARLHLRFAIAGSVVAAAGFALGAIDTPRVAFWTTSWSTFLVQAGVMTAAIWGAWKLMAVGRVASLSEPIILLGRTSLFVYWVHVELAYGFLSYPLHHALSLSSALVGLAGMYLGMYSAARWWAARPSARPWIPSELRAQDTART